jgi:hypothetical protein
MFSQPLPATFSGRQMTVLLGLTSAAASFLSAETFGRWPWDSRNYAFAGTAGGGVFRKRPTNYLGAGRSEPEASPYANAAALRLIHAIDDGLLITAGATRPLCWLALDKLSVPKVIFSRAVRITGTRE